MLDSNRPLTTGPANNLAVKLAILQRRIAKNLPLIAAQHTKKVNIDKTSLVIAMLS